MNKNVCIRNNKILIYLYVYTVIITLINVCLQNINESEEH